MTEETPTPDAETAGASRDPAARIQALSADLRAAEAVITELKGRDLAGTVTTLEAAAAEHATASEAWEAERSSWEAERGAWGSERALLSAGVTSAEGQAVARALYHLQPEADRGTLGDWLSTAGTAPPPALAPYLRTAAAPAAPAAAPVNGSAVAVAAAAPLPGTPTEPKATPTQAQVNQLTSRMLLARGPARDSLRAQLAKLTSRG